MVISGVSAILLRKSALDGAASSMKIAPMGHGVLTFVGRDEELRELEAAVRAANEGRGSLYMLAGEPGVGKSRLVEELVRGVDDLVVCWGRCWEAGGAPAYLPWVQILRALLRRSELGALVADPARAAVVGPLLPELASDARRPIERTEDARFVLMDALCSLLLDAASRRPLLLVLEDLHEADPSSLLLLDYLARQAHAAPLLIVATVRDTAIEASPHLLRIAQNARTITLGRLARGAVERYIEAAFGTAVADGLCDAAWSRTEGHPLFLVELSRLLLSQHGAEKVPATHARAIPGTVRTAIRERVSRLSSLARAALAKASVVGREVPIPWLLRAFVDDPSIEEGLHEAASAALLTSVDPGVLRFTHILVRDVVYDDVHEAERRRFHFQVAEALRRAPASDGDRVWTEIAHHYFASGPEAMDAAIEAIERASRRHLDQLAFPEAIAACQRGLDAMASTPGSSELRRAELLRMLGHAQLRAGAIAAGQASCMASAALSRELGDSDLFARAVLELGGIFHFGHVDARLVDLLGEALERLEPSDSRLRACALSRLAAALQPAPDPRGPIDLARDAIAMARRLGDEETLVEVLRAACSTMVDLVDARERLPLDAEHLALAEKRSDRVESLRANLRLAFDRFELGDVAGARRNLDRMRALAEDLSSPHYRWRARSVDALLTLWDGRLDEAERALTEAEQLAGDSGDPNAVGTLLQQRLQLARLREDGNGMVELASRLEASASGGEVGRALACVVAAGQLAATGRIEEALRVHTAEAVDRVLSLGDRTMLLPLAELAAGTGDVELARRLSEPTIRMRGANLHAGIMGMVWYGPAERACELVRRTLRADPSPSVASDTSDTFTMHREGDAWRVAWGETAFFVKDVRGLHLLARLVAEPGRERHVLDLATEGASDAGVDRGDGGAAVDEQARDAYRRRIEALEEERVEAEEWNDLERAERARDELDAIRRELARGFGLGGRSRREKNAVERARVNVQRRLRDAVRRISDQNAALGRHLERSIRTGTYCCYAPD